MFAAVYAPGHHSGKPETMLECARQFTPRIEVTSPDTLLLDIGGLDHLFGSPPEIAQTIAKRLNLPANVAISSDPDTAVYIARATSGVTVISPGKEARALAALPVTMLPLTPETAETFECWESGILGNWQRFRLWASRRVWAKKGSTFSNSRVEKWVGICTI